MMSGMSMLPTCSAETFTAIFSGLSQEAASRQAVRRTHSPMGRIRPVSSAMGMNSIGWTTPRPGWRQRNRAS